VEADDLGEASVEQEDPATGKRFVALSAQIDQRFDDLRTLATRQERQPRRRPTRCGSRRRPTSRRRRRPGGRAALTTRWVLHQACRQLARWRSELPQAAGLSVSVNVSARQLQDASIVEDVESALRETGLDPGSLILELTESAVIENFEGASATLQKLRWMSCSWPWTTSAPATPR
jgi:hypothetical protein